MLITDRTTVQNTKVSIRSFMGMVTSDTSQEIVTPKTLASSTSGNVNTANLTVTTETLLQTKGIESE